MEMPCKTPAERERDLQFTVMDELPPDTPERIVLTRRILNDLQGPLMAVLRRYVDLLMEAEELRCQHPHLNALIEAIEGRKVKKLARLIENGDAARERNRRVALTLLQLRQGESSRDS